MRSNEKKGEDALNDVLGVFKPNTDPAITVSERVDRISHTFCLEYLLLKEFTKKILSKYEIGENYEANKEILGHDSYAMFYTRFQQTEPELSKNLEAAKTKVMKEIQKRLKDFNEKADDRRRFPKMAVYIDEKQSAGS